MIKEKQTVVTTNEIMDLLVSMKNDADARFDKVDQRFDGVDQRLDRVESRLTSVEQRLDDVEVSCTQNTVAIHTLEAKVDARFDKLEKTIFSDVNALVKDSEKQAGVLRKHERRIHKLELARA